MLRLLGAPLALLLALALAFPADAHTVKDLTRIRGQGDTILRGLGLVVGLPGTGDSAKELALARPLASVLANEGNPLGSPKDIGSAKSVAVVLVTCIIPEGGARMDDRFDVKVAVCNSAKSLAGGTLYLCPLRTARKDSDVYAIAAGDLEIEDAAAPTTARVRGGARIARDILGPDITDVFDLVIDPHFSGYTAASEIAAAINASAQPQGPGVASVIDDRMIRITIPEWERKDKSAFIAAVLTAEVNMGLLGLPATVIVNSRTGHILMTADVEIAPVAVTHKSLSITTTVPPPQPTAQNPLVETARWAGIKTAARPSDNARLADLLAAFKQLNVPVADQIDILQMLHKTGRLHARLVID